MKRKKVKEIIKQIEKDVLKDEKKIKKRIYKEAVSLVKKEVRAFHYFFRYKYPKFFLLVISVVVACYIFKNPSVSNYLNALNNLSYVGVIIAGMLLSFGFSAPFAVGFFITLHPPNIYLAAILGGVGALVSDMFIFKFIKTSFLHEFENLKKEKPMRVISTLIKRNVKLKIKNYIMYFLAGIVIATPLPDEVGVTMLAGLTKIKPKILGLISFILHTSVIFLIFYLTN